MRSLAFTEAAATDYNEACRWYAADREGRDLRFAATVETLLLHMRRSPASFRVIRGPYRRAVVKHFPYTILFTFDDAQVVVHAVFHNARSPDELRDRLRKT